MTIRPQRLVLKMREHRRQQSQKTSPIIPQKGKYMSMIGKVLGLGCFVIGCGSYYIRYMLVDKVSSEDV